MFVCFLNVICAQEFVHGQMYIAMSRVKSSDNLQVINFHCKFLLPPSPELVNVARNTCLQPTEMYSCCSFRPLDKSNFVAGDSVMMFHKEIQSIESNKDETDVTDETIEGEEFFETTKGTATCKLEDNLLCLIRHFETELSTPTIYVYHGHIPHISNY